VKLILLKNAFHAFTCASNIQSYIYVVFCENVDECSKTRLGHVVTQCINIPPVFCSSCINKNMPSGVLPEKLGCPRCRDMHEWWSILILKPFRELKKAPSSRKLHSVILTLSTEKMLKESKSCRRL